VVAILPAPHESPGLIFAPGQRLELDFDKSIGDRNGFLDAPRKRAAAVCLSTLGLLGAEESISTPSGVSRDRHATLPPGGSAPG